MSILINSSNRTSGTTHDAKYSLHNPIKGRYELINMSIPASMFNIDSTNNVVILSENAFVTNYTITLPIGDYSSATLATTLKTLLDASSASGTFTVTVEITGFLKIVSTVAFELSFSSEGAKKVFGFESTLTPQATSFTGTNIINLTKPSNIAIHFDDTNNSNIEEIVTGDTFDIYAQMNTEFTYFKETTDYKQIIEFNRTRSLNIKIKNATNGLMVDLNGADYSILLKKID